jgi:sigma-E factor negative regulatory protein RseA
MSEKVENQISELVDGELHSAEQEKLFNKLKNDSQLKATWHRYNLIGDAMRNNLPENIQHDLTNRISAALESEPAFLVPQTPEKPNTEQTSKDDNVVEIFPAAREQQPRRLGFGAGLATAATVALAVVFGTQIFQSDDPAAVPVALQQPESGVQSNVAMQASQGPVNANVATVSAQGNTDNVMASPRLAVKDPFMDGEWKRLDQQGTPQMSPYIVEHNEFATGNGVQQGVFPFARVVSFGENEAQ